mmetsp:Transcript_23397/g.55255  ORF Transcript_23397/g.55255 Transcript_23397/m.55255 type:complete len:115 (+) Transcript_23397:1117-1461(+)
MADDSEEDTHELSAEVEPDEDELAFTQLLAESTVDHTCDAHESASEDERSEISGNWGSFVPAGFCQVASHELGTRFNRAESSSSSLSESIDSGPANDPPMFVMSMRNLLFLASS